MIYASDMDKCSVSYHETPRQGHESKPHPSFNSWGAFVALQPPSKGTPPTQAVGSHERSKNQKATPIPKTTKMHLGKKFEGQFVHKNRLLPKKKKLEPDLLTYATMPNNALYHKSKYVRLGPYYPDEKATSLSTR